MPLLAYGMLVYIPYAAGNGPHGVCRATSAISKTSAPTDIATAPAGMNVFKEIKRQCSFYNLMCCTNVGMEQDECVRRL
jgi:hypothetical protein